MADKLILNANLVCRDDRFVPKRCTVEKVIEVTDTVFRRLIGKPLERSYFLIQYKDLMGYYDNSNHGVLFVNKQSGDGFFVNSEGYDYARYSQFIPNAKALIQVNEQTAALENLKHHMNSCIDSWLEENENEKYLCISLSEFINDRDLEEILAEYASESLNNHPQIKSCTIGNGFIEAEKNELAETKLYCPLKFLLEPDNDYSDLLEVSPSDYIEFADKINRKIKESFESDEDLRKRGLMAFSDNQKIHSAFVCVEARNGELYGAVTVKCYGELSKAELADITDELSGQLSDGWGEGFEQHPVTLGGDKVYISFWNSEDYFLKPENKVFPEQDLEQTMGGIT